MAAPVDSTKLLSFDFVMQLASNILCSLSRLRGNKSNTVLEDKEGGNNSFAAYLTRKSFDKDGDK